MSFSDRSPNKRKLSFDTTLPEAKVCHACKLYGAKCSGLAPCSFCLKQNYKCTYKNQSEQRTNYEQIKRRRYGSLPQSKLLELLAQQTHREAFWKNKFYQLSCSAGLETETVLEDLADSPTDFPSEESAQFSPHTMNNCLKNFSQKVMKHFGWYKLDMSAPIHIIMWKRLYLGNFPNENYEYLVFMLDNAVIFLYGAFLSNELNLVMLFEDRINRLVDTITQQDPSFEKIPLSLIPKLVSSFLLWGTFKALRSCSLGILDLSFLNFSTKLMQRGQPLDPKLEYGIYSWMLWLGSCKSFEDRNFIWNKCMELKFQVQTIDLLIFVNSMSLFLSNRSTSSPLSEEISRMESLYSFIEDTLNGEIKNQLYTDEEIKMLQIGLWSSESYFALRNRKRDRAEALALQAVPLIKSSEWNTAFSHVAGWSIPWLVQVLKYTNLSEQAKEVLGVIQFYSSSFPVLNGFINVSNYISKTLSSSTSESVKIPVSNETPPMKPSKIPTPILNKLQSPIRGDVSSTRSTKIPSPLSKIVYPRNNFKDFSKHRRQSFHSLEDLKDSVNTPHLRPIRDETTFMLLPESQSINEDYYLDGLNHYSNPTLSHSFGHPNVSLQSSYYNNASLPSDYLNASSLDSDHPHSYSNPQLFSGVEHDIESFPEPKPYAPNFFVISQPNANFQSNKHVAMGTPETTSTSSPTPEILSQIDTEQTIGVAGTELDGLSFLPEDGTIPWFQGND